MTQIYLEDLPEEHPQRNTPLEGVCYVNRNQKIVRHVLPTYGIAKSTYNNLGSAWRDTSHFWWDSFKDKP